MTPRRSAAGVLSCLLLCAAAFIPACGPPPVSPVEATRGVLEARIGPAEAEGPVYCRYDQICGSDVLPSFYRARDFRPAWIDDGLTLDDASSFLAALRLVDEDGLDPANYHLAAIETLITEIRASREKKRNKIGPDTLVDLEMLLTDAFFLCGSHLVHGQVDPETVQSDWFIKGRIEDLTAALEKGLAGKRHRRGPRILPAAKRRLQGPEKGLSGPRGRRRGRRLAGIPARSEAREREP